MSRPSTFTPLHTLCPPCAKNEVEAFERYMVEKFNSRSGSDDAEWIPWFEKAVRDRDAERDADLRAQEKAVRDKGPVQWVEKVVPVVREEEKRGKLRKVKKEKKRGILRRWFSSGV